MWHNQRRRYCTGRCTTYPLGFRTRLHRKDLGIALETARTYEVPVQIASLVATIELVPEISGETSGVIFGFVMSVASTMLVVAWAHQRNLARLKEELGERVKAETALAASLREKEVMLKGMIEKVESAGDSG